MNTLYRLVLSRSPTSDEIRDALSYLSETRDGLQSLIAQSELLRRTIESGQQTIREIKDPVRKRMLESVAKQWPDESAILAGLKPGSIFLEMSTIDPDTSRKLAREVRAQGSDMVDSPVGKTAEHAVSGTLTLMVGGDAHAVARVRPILDCMGTDFFHCGELGAGHAMKCVNNLLATTLVAVNSEMLAAGMKAGLTLDVMTGVMQKTMAWNNQLAIGFPARPLRGDFEAGFMLKLAHKDCRLAMTMIRNMGLTAPVGAATLAVCQEGLDAGYATKDVGVLLKLREDLAGLKVRLAAKP